MPNSLDCNLLDYYAWGAFEEETNKTMCNTEDELKARITISFTNSEKDTVRKVCR